MQPLNVDNPSRVAPALLALLVAAAGCDLGAKSVGETADDAGEGGDSDSNAASDESDGNTSQGETGDDDAPGEPACLETTTVLDDSAEVTALGFPADAVIAISNGWSSQLAWLPNDGPVMVTPAGTTAELQIGLTYSGGEIRFIESVANPDAPLEFDADCGDRIELEVDITFSTDDGLFAESFVAVGTTSSAGRLDIQEYFAPDAFAGTFSDADVTFRGGDGTVDRFAIFAQFSGRQPPTGEVFVEASFADLGGGSVGFGVLAAFPNLPE